MDTQRLYVDGRGIAWAVVQCERCNGVHKYPGPAALAGPFACADCGASLDVGAELLFALTRRLNPFDRTGAPAAPPVGD